MYELTIAGAFGVEQHIAIVTYDKNGDFVYVHNFPADASAMDAMKLLEAFNAAYELGFSEGLANCGASHEKPRTAWYSDYVGGPARLKSERPVIGDGFTESE